MKKLKLYILTVFLSLSMIPLSTDAADKSVSKTPPKSIESAQAKTLIARLDEIKTIDKSKLNSTEKKQLRKEVRAIKTNLAQLGGGVYLSVGAIIIILLVLILLL